jgi:hypothetical protein
LTDTTGLAITYLELEVAVVEVEVILVLLVLLESLVVLLVRKVL